MPKRSQPAPVGSRKARLTISRGEEPFQAAEQLHQRDRQPEEMIQLYEKAIQLGHSQAQSRLAYFYQTKHRNETEMKTLYRASIKRGQIQSMINLASHYRTVGKKEKMLSYFHLAISFGSVAAMRKLADYYVEEEADYLQAKMYYEMASERGCSDALLETGLCYFQLEDYANMVIWCQRAIDLQNTEAMIFLGYYYQTIGQDIPQMKKLYHRALALGNPEAQLKLARYYLDQTPTTWKENPEAVTAVTAYHQQLSRFLQMDPRWDLPDPLTQEVIRLARRTLTAVEQSLA